MLSTPRFARNIGQRTGTDELFDRRDASEEHARRRHANEIPIPRKSIQSGALLGRPPPRSARDPPDNPSHRGKFRRTCHDRLPASITARPQRGVPGMLAFARLRLLAIKIDYRNWLRGLT